MHIRSFTIQLRHVRYASLLLSTLLAAGCASVSSVPSPPERSPVPSSPAAQGASVEPVATADPQQAFTQWVMKFRASARAAGIDEATLQAAFGDVRFVPRAIEADKAQPEFTRTVWDYLDTAVSAQRVSRGAAKLAELRKPGGLDIDAIAARYGIPAEVLVAIWGMESSYGSFMGDIPAIDALATLGFEGRREEWARGQLMAALKILQTKEVSKAQMVGSWAGAMGQTQFLPTTFLAYAVDADGDGRRDIWSSLPDVMASTAHFLARSGWVPGQEWGQEVRLPAGFDYARADLSQRQSSVAWARDGVQAMDGGVLSNLPDASVFLPAGARGPAFLVGNNFRTVLRYNNANSYALAVHLLAQRLGGGAPPQTPWPRELQALTRSQVLTMQSALNAKGFDTGAPDGVAGPATQRGVRQFQRSLGLPADGFLTVDLLQRIQTP
ncbi:lytic murein transglycosylase [Rhodoferax aquaticus]|uniref:Lytic murein transglycosylase n=1 Tax=Rhodoferax aquaticus TaxID=2527691 RepID=A0A515ESN0_9BURK|nr:lytic murein transglycosylase [Rhodoferax aquaticus]QDL55664.1 lytic murein transglycosylase [Rhodoferax aquaticus]